MNMKNVLFIIGGLHGGGAEKALVELLANFDYERYHVTLCVVYYSGIYMSQIPEPVSARFLKKEIFPLFFEERFNYASSLENFV